MAQAIQRITLSEQVANAIKGLIAEKGLGPGDKLPSEPVLGREFGVSRIVVREALRALSSAGVLHIHHGKGTFIAEFNGRCIAEQLSFGLTDDRSFFDQMIDLRLVVESGGLDLSAARATAEDWARLREIISEMRVAAETGSPTEPVDLQFHKTLLDAAKNAPLSRLGDVLAAFFRLAADAYPPLSAMYTPEEQVREHEAILGAVEAGEVDKAKQLLKEALERYKTLPSCQLAG
ncbi:MAG: FadR/GntR family transcriptional regulator [Dehalococcoidales bacterium]|nr:FadR/GntR family transcriptional regulator [Dehalococcoidales bacterium]